MIENDFERHKNEAAVKKLRRVQTELRVPKGQWNDYGGYKFRSCEDILEAVKPLLAEQELTLIISDHIHFIEGRFYLVATATVIDPNTGAAISANGFAREAVSKKGMDDSQVTGSASSYARKYALNGLFAIDDTKDADSNEQRKEQAGRATAQAKNGADEQRKESESRAPKKTDEAIKCADCGKAITNHGKMSAQAIADGTVKTYGRALCYGCAEKAAAARKGAENVK